MNRLLTPFLATLLLAPTAIGQVTADHLAFGKMWTFENPPLAYLEKEYGFKPDEKWLNSLRLSALRLGEVDNPWCSASFVSPQGLIMTNHHCVRDEIAKAQGPDNWVKNGFASTSLEDEVKLPGLTVQQLVAQEDVTAKVDEGVKGDDDDITTASKRRANIEAIVQAANAAHPGHMHEVVSLFQGAVQQLYRYRVWDDLRLVVAPHLQTAHYGGDPDNFTYPRWSIDFSFLRAYVDGKPADTTAHYFRWRQTGAEENELVFVPGNPGNTNRLMTMQQLMLQRDVEYPMVVEQLGNWIEILEPYKDRQPQFLTTLLSWQNGYKSYKGMLDGLRDQELMQKKQLNEIHLRGAVSENKELGKLYGDLWREIDALVGKQRDLLPRAMFHQPGYSSVLQRGVLVAQALDETVDEEERKAARDEAVKIVTGSNPLIAALMLDQMQRAEKWLPKNDPFLAAVGGELRTARGTDWTGALRELIKSELRRDRFVRQVLDQPDGAEIWLKSTDVGVVAARTLWPLMRSAEQTQQQLDDAMAVQGTRMGRVLHAVYGSNISPDATMTLRFSDGRVQGFDYNGTVAPWATTFYGLFGRGVAFGNRYPFDIPQAWLENRDKLDLTKRVCFASTNDIVGGNSGSCVVDRELRIVGLIFDGNIESLANDFYFTQDVARAVSVHTDAIVSALEHVYGMTRIVEELRAGATR